MIIERNLFLKEWIYCFERQKKTRTYTHTDNANRQEYFEKKTKKKQQLFAFVK